MIDRDINMPDSPAKDRKRWMGRTSFFTAFSRISLFESRHRSSSSYPLSESSLGLPCIERLSSIYLDCCCAETGLEEIQDLRGLKLNDKKRRRSLFLRDILLGRRNTTLF